MAHAGNGRHRTLHDPKLYTLTEIARNINVSMPTAQRYKRVYQARIPSVGRGRRQRYPREALKVFEQIKTENLSRRGRPPKSGYPTPSQRRRGTPAARQSPKSKRARGSKASTSSLRKKTPARGKAVSPDLLTLTEISHRTGISYPTCINYVKKHIDQIPHVGTGRKRRFPVEAVPVFAEIRKQSRRGRRKSATSGPSRTERAVLKRIRELEKGQRHLAKQMESLLKALQAPLTVTIKRR